MRIEIVSDNTAVRRRHLRYLATIVPALLPLGIGLAVRVSIRGGVNDLFYYGIVSAYAIFAGVLLVFWRQFRSFGRSIGDAQLLVVASWRATASVVGGNISPPAEVAKRLLDTPAGAYLYLVCKRAVMTWPPTLGSPVEYSMSLNEATIIRLYVDGDRAGMVELVGPNGIERLDAWGRVGPEWNTS